jgi:diguanylate cyclase (GGDEF)-like protein
MTLATDDKLRKADQGLKVLVGLTVLLGAVATGASVVEIRDNGVAGDHMPSWTGLAALTLLVALGDHLNARVRVRSILLGTAWPDAAVLIGLAVMPAEWVVLATVVGISLNKAIRRVRFVRAVFGAAKEATTAAVGGLVLFGLGAEGSPDTHPGAAALALAFVTMTLVDDLLYFPVVALSSRTRLIDRYLANWDIRQFMLVGRFLVALAALWALQVEQRLIYALPMLVLILHLWHERWVRTREERQAWQDLADATDSFTTTDLDTVLRNAVTRGAKLFSADAIEVDVWLGANPRLVRGGSDAIAYQGDPRQAPTDPAKVYPVALHGYEGDPNIGAFRLRFRDQITISEREQAMLHTYAAALETAVRNAVAYQRLGETTRQHARAAAHDPLTDLPNRRELAVQTAAALTQRGDGVVAMMLLDLDHFKEVNDTLGHVAGDRVLTAIADRLAAAAGPDDLVTRFGGDEFAVLLRRLPAPALATPRAEHLLDAFAEPVDLDELPITVRASAGVATAVGAADVTELIRRADVALHQAKRAGHRLVAYSAQRDTTDRDRLALGGQLRRAVAEGEFVLNFQPIVELASGRVVAAEALARWRHPVHGELDPPRFLDTLERSEQLPAFTTAVLDQALAAAAAWRQSGHDLGVSVNISARSLLDPGFPEQVQAALEAHATAPDRLCLELTETLALSQLEVVDQVLGRLHEAGVRLALDDFGTGWSSLAVLSRIPVHELKVDREFVAGMLTSGQALAVVRSTAELGRSLGLNVVAEGVETEAQRLALWELGCAGGQGHLFARPLSQEQLRTTLDDGVSGAPGVLASPLHGDAPVVHLRSKRPAPQLPAQRAE